MQFFKNIGPGKKIFFLIFFFMLASYFLNAQPDPLSVCNLELPAWVKSKNVLSFCKDKNEKLWIGTNRDILCYNSFEYTDYSFILDSLHEGAISYTIFEFENRIYFGTSHGLIEYNYLEKKTVFYRNEENNPNSIGNNKIYQHQIDKNGKIWLALWGGIDCFDPRTKKFEHFQPYDSTIYRNNVVYDILSFGDTLWVATWSGGVLGFDKNNKTFFNPFSMETNEILKKTQIKSIALNGAEGLWIGAWGEGLYQYNLKTQEFKLSAFSEKLSSNRISFIETDKNGSVWVGTEFGLNQITGKGEVNQYHGSYRPKRSLMTSYVNCVYADNSGFVWVGSNGGFSSVKTHGNGLEVYTDWLFNVDYKDHVYEVFVVDSTRIYLATAKNGLFLFDAENREIRKIHGAIDINEIEIDASYIWLGTSGGLYQCTYDGQTMAHVKEGKEPYGLSHFQVKTICSDVNDNIWVGTYKGLNKIDKENFVTRHYYGNELSKEIIHNNIKYVFADSFHLWALDLEGINKISLSDYDVLEKYNFSNELLKYGACDNFLKTEDTLKCFFNKAVLNFCISSGKLELDNSFVNLKSVKNLIYFSSSDYWVYYNKKLYRKHNGKNFEYELQDIKSVNGIINYNEKIILYGDNGFYIFNPNKYTPENENPFIVLSSFVLTDNSIRSEVQTEVIQDKFFIEDLTLKHHQNNVTFLFTVLDYRQNINWEYQYKLKGFNNNWVATQGEKKAVFTNLKPGEYSFYVQARIENNAWNDQKLLVKFNITPPFWRTWLFKILSILLAIFLFILFYYLRTVQLRRKNLLLKRLVKERTSEIESQKEELRAQADVLQETNSLLKERQEEIESQRDELSTLNATKDKFFSIIAHDLKNPFMGIMGIAELLLKKYQKLDQVQTREFIEGIYSSSKTAYSLLENLLNWSHSQTKRIEQKPEPVNVLEVIEQCFALLKLNFSDKNISQKIDCSPEIDAFADRQMLTTIIRNLVNNAIKFTPEKGEVNAFAFVENDIVVIQIADTGVGMPENTKQKLFRIDAQVSTTGTSGEPGTGLGLIVVKEFIEKNNGTIEVKSAEGKGSVFIIRLPKSAKAKVVKTIEKPKQKTYEHTPEITESDSVELENMLDKINYEDIPVLLLVEDNHMIRKKIAEDLKSRLDVVLAANGGEGLEKALSVIPDVVITDINMPEMDGLQLCKFLKSDERTSHIPVIMLTTRDEAEQKLEGLETGADDYITKPFDARELVLRIHNTLQTRQNLRENILKNLSFETSKLPVSSLDEKFIAKVIAIVESNLDDPDFELSVLVNEIGMSQAQLYRKMKALTGQTVIEFVKTLRLKRAAELIREGKYSVSDAAYATGFKNLSHFSKAFKDQIGVAPSKYSH